MKVLSAADVEVLDGQVETLYDFKRLTENEVKELCAKAKEVLTSEPNVKQVRSPVTIVGDVHGQFHDLKELFRVAGKSPGKSFVNARVLFFVAAVFKFESHLNLLLQTPTFYSWGTT